MKINFFTFQKNSATAIGYKNVLSEYDNMTFQSNDFVNFDVNLFTGFKKEVDFLINKEKEINKKTLIGIVDPKNINILKKYVTLILLLSTQLKWKFTLENSKNLYSD